MTNVMLQLCESRQDIPCHFSKSFPLQGMRSRWKDYARRVLQWQKASSRGSKGDPEVSGDAHESLKEKVLLQQQHSLDVKQMKEVAKVLKLLPVEM